MTILVVHGSGSGCSASYASAIALALEDLGRHVRLAEARTMPSMDGVAGVIAVGGIRAGKWNRGLTGWLRANRDRLQRTPYATVTVCMAATGRTPADRAEARGYLDPLLASLGSEPVARLEAPGWMLLSKFTWSERLLLKATNNVRDVGDHRDLPAAAAWARETAPLLDLSWPPTVIA